MFPAMIYSIESENNNTAQELKNVFLTRPVHSSTYYGPNNGALFLDGYVGINCGIVQIFENSIMAFIQRLIQSQSSEQ